MPRDPLVQDIGEATDKSKRLRLRQATIIAAPGLGIYTIRFGTAGTDATYNITGVHALSSVTPVVNDAVWVLQNGPDLLIIGKLNPGTPGSTAMYSDGIELYHASSTPYIDFHYAANPAGDSNADYRWRIIMYSDRLEYQYVGVGWKHIMYSDGEFACHHIGVNGDNVANLGVSIDGGNVRIQGAAGRNWFKDSERSSGTGLRVGAAWARYGIYAEDGDVVIGSNDNRISFQNDGLGFWNGSELRCNTAFSLPALAFYTKAYGDGNHRLQYSSGLDSMEYWSWGGHRFILAGVLKCWISGTEWYVGDGSNLRGHYYKFDQLGDYGVVSLLIHSAGGGTGARIGFWSQGQNAAQILKCWGSTIEGRSWDDVGWGTINAVLGNMSSKRWKSNVKQLKVTKAERQDRRERHKRVKPVHYNRKHSTGCPNCRATGVATKDQAKHVDGLNHGDTCPDCNGTGEKGLDTAQLKSEESGWYGFTAEDLAVEFPEAVFYDDQEKPLAVDSLAVAAILWDRVHELDERLDALEAKPK